MSLFRRMNEFELSNVIGYSRRLSRRIEYHIIIIYKLQLNNADLLLNVKFIKTFNDLKDSRTTQWTDELPRPSCLVRVASSKSLMDLVSYRLQAMFDRYCGRGRI